jgi:hypothetical protein
MEVEDVIPKKFKESFDLRLKLNCLCCGIVPQSRTCGPHAKVEVERLPFEPEILGMDEQFAYMKFFKTQCPFPTT